MDAHIRSAGHAGERELRARQFPEVAHGLHAEAVPPAPGGSAYDCATRTVRRARAAWLVCFACALIVGLPGCSQVEKVVTHASRVGELAREDKEAWATVADVAPEASAAGMARCDEILGEVDGIHKAASQTKDNSVWDRLGGLIETAMWAAIAVAACVLVVYIGSKTGIFDVIGAWIRIVPPAKKREANLLLDTLDAEKPESVREAVAAMRGRDPLLDLAMEREKRRRQRRPAGAPDQTPSQET